MEYIILVGVLILGILGILYKKKMYKKNKGPTGTFVPDPDADKEDR